MADARADVILLVSTRWQTRALLAAELGDRAGRDVVSVADVNAALGSIKLGALEPTMIVVDTGRGIGAEDIERLVEAKREVLLVLVLSRLRRDAFDALRERCAVVLVRPVRIGTIAQAVAGVLEDQTEDG